MNNTTFRSPQQSRSQQTLERILSSSTTLISEKAYDSVSIAEIASSARISVGGFYSRFKNKEALFNALQIRFAHETQERIDRALAADWSQTSLRELLEFVVTNNAKLYDKYRGVLTAIYIRTRVLEPGTNKGLQSYNENIVKQLEALILTKRDEMSCRQYRVAVRTAIACMAAMLRDAIVFRDRSLYPKPATSAVVTKQVAAVMYHHLTAGAA